MKEIRKIIEEHSKYNDDNRAMALATVYEVKGSSYRRSGARMLIKDDGNWFGGISGGCIEGNALKQAHMAMANGKAKLVTYDTENDDEAKIGVSLGCNGLISVIITPIDNSNFDPINQLNKILKANEPAVLITALNDLSDNILAGAVLLKDDIQNYKLDKTGVLLETIEAVEESKKSRVVEIDNMRLFVEYIPADIHLVIMGSNYDVYPLLKITNDLGWQTSIISKPNRLFKPAREITNNVKSALAEVEISDQTVAVVMAHDYSADLNNLKDCLQSEIGYIGVLGPAVRRNDMINELKESGLEVDEERIFGPAGLDIGAIQPEEIAIAIISEIIAVLRNRDASSLRNRAMPIHDR